MIIPNIWKNKDVPNHQPVIHSWDFPARRVSDLRALRGLGQGLWQPLGHRSLAEVPWIRQRVDEVV